MSDEHHRYAIAYQIDPKADATKEELAARDGSWGGCDRLVLISIMGQAGNGEHRSQMLVGLGPNNTPLPPEEIFTCWELMAQGLMREEKLHEGARTVARLTFEAIRASRLVGTNRRSLAIKFAKQLVHDLENGQ